MRGFLYTALAVVIGVGFAVASAHDSGKWMGAAWDGVIAAIIARFAIMFLED